MAKKDAEKWVFVLKTAQSVCKESIAYQKFIFFLFVTSVLFICKFTVKVEYSSTRGKSATTVLTSDGTKGSQEK